MELVLDIQGLRNCKKEFVVKELAVLNVPYGPSNTDKHKVIVFKPPHPEEELTEEVRKINNEAVNCYHGLSWVMGERNYGSLQSTLIHILSGVSVVIVKGKGVQQWLENIIGKMKEIINLEELGFCLQLNSGFDPRLCKYGRHHSKAATYRCALANIYKMREWYIKNSCPFSSVAKSLALFAQLSHISMMRDEDFVLLPKEMMISFAPHRITYVWDKLPEYLKSDPEMYSYTKCLEHHENNSNGDVVDNFAKLIRDCKICNEVTIFSNINK